MGKKVGYFSRSMPQSILLIQTSNIVAPISVGKDHSILQTPASMFDDGSPIWAISNCAHLFGILASASCAPPLCQVPLSPRYLNYQPIYYIIQMPKAKQTRSKKDAHNDKDSDHKQPQLRTFQIYNQLLTDSTSDLPSKLNQLLEQSQDSYKLSLLVFFLKLMGLSHAANDITLVDIRSRLNSIIAKVEEDPKLLSNIHLTDTSADQHRLFSLNFTDLLSDGFFTDSNRMITSVPVLQWFVDWLSILSNCKLRAVRNASIEVATRMIGRCIRFYEEKDSVARRALKKFMQGMSEIVRERMKDVDKKIRVAACDTMYSIYICLENQIMTIEELKNTFGSMIEDKREQISLLGLVYTKKLFFIEKNPLLMKFANIILQRVYHLSLKYKDLAPAAVDLLITFKRYSDNIQIKLPSIVNLICKLCKHEESYTLKLIAELFYVTAFEPYALTEDKRKARPQINPKELVSCVVNSFATDPEELKLKIRIFCKLIEFDPSLYGLDLLFELLDRQELLDLRSGDFERMDRSQLQAHLVLIFSYTSVMKQCIQIQFSQRQRRLEQYSSKLFEAARKIVFEQIPQNPTLTQDFIRLFTALSPKSDKDEHRKDIEAIFQEFHKIFNSSRDPKLHQAILQALSLIYPEGIKIILDDLSVEKFYDLDEAELGKISAISGAVDFTQKFRLSVLSEMMPKFFSTKNQMNQSYILNVLHHGHALKLRSLFKQIDESSLDAYIDYRNSFVSFLLNVLKKDSITLKIKELSFRCLCETLSLILHNKVSEIEILYFDLTDDMVNSMFLFLHQVFLNKDPEYSLDQMFPKFTSIDEAEINPTRAQLLREIVFLSTQALRFGTMPLPTKLLITLLKSKKFKSMVKEGLLMMIRQQTLEENSNRFVFWKMFRSMVFSSYIKDEEKKPLYDELLSLYFSVPSFAHHRKAYNHKFILFCAESIDQAFKNKRFNHFKVLADIITKTSRRFPKQTLSTLLGLTEHKITTIEEARESQECQGFKKLLRKLVGSGERNKKKDSQRGSKGQRQESSSSERSSSSESENSRSSRSGSVASKRSSHSSSDNDQSSSQDSRATSPAKAQNPRRTGKQAKSISKQKTKDREVYGKKNSRRR